MIALAVVMCVILPSSGYGQVYRTQTGAPYPDAPGPYWVFPGSSMGFAYDGMNPGCFEWGNGLDDDTDGQVDDLNYGVHGAFNVDRDIWSDTTHGHNDFYPDVDTNPNDRYYFTATPGTTISFFLRVENYCIAGMTIGGDVSMNLYGGQLPGSNLSATAGYGVLESEFSWTPSAADAGQMFTQEFQGTFPDGYSGYQTTYITVVPEPSTFALFIVGATSLLAYAWRRRRQAA
jgi:PEP-CTERM motif